MNFELVGYVLELDEDDVRFVSPDGELCDRKELGDVLELLDVPEQEALVRALWRAQGMLV